MTNVPILGEGGYIFFSVHTLHKIFIFASYVFINFNYIYSNYYSKYLCVIKTVFKESKGIFFFQKTDKFNKDKSSNINEFHIHNEIINAVLSPVP